MLVLTADQRNSRAHEDLVPAAIAEVERVAAGRLCFAVDRNAGDELQAATQDGRAALDIALHLVRAGTWSVGIGVGAVQSPVPTEIRAARGPGFIHAREAVERAKSSPWRLAVSGVDDRAAHAEALVRLLLELRERRSARGWEVADLLSDGLSQKQIAERLGITETAVSLRAKAAGLRSEEAAIPALAQVLDDLNRRGTSVSD